MHGVDPTLGAMHRPRSKVGNHLLLNIYHPSEAQAVIQGVGMEMPYSEDNLRGCQGYGRALGTL